MRTGIQRGALIALAACCLSFVAPAVAEPADYVVSPIVEDGEREIDLKAGSAALPGGMHQDASSVGLGWAPNSRWFTEVYAKWHKDPGQPRGFDAWEWENRLQLTETGEYPVDVGLLFEVERPKDRAEGYEYRWGTLLQADLTTRIQANLNLLVQKRIRTSEAADAEFGYQWQLDYRWMPALELGLQGFGAVGPWNDWAPTAAQQHLAGPAVFGRIDLGGRRSIRYNAGVLLGLNSSSPHSTVRVQAEYEF
jgi:hypothetical protein